MLIYPWCRHWRHAILPFKVALKRTDSDVSPDVYQGKLKCQIMPSLTKTQATLLLFFLESEKNLDPIRIMKGLFIFTMEAPLSWLPPGARYRFVPYSYGPYSREVDADLNRLTLWGYLQQSHAPGKTWNYYSLTDLGKQQALQSSRDFPLPAVRYLQTVREFVLGLTFRKLLDAVYEKYPQYAVNSVFKS